MNMWEKIDAQSRDTKAQYAFIIATAVTGVIAIFWMLSLSTRFADIKLRTGTGEIVNEDLNGLITGTRDQLGNVIDSVQESADIIKALPVADNLSTLDVDVSGGDTVSTSDYDVTTTKDTMQVVEDEVLKEEASVDTVPKEKKVLIEVTKKMPATTRSGTTTSGN